MTPSQQAALKFARENGGVVYAGTNAGARGVVKFSSFTLISLERAAYLERRENPTGGCMWVIPEIFDAD